MRRGSTLLRSYKRVQHVSPLLASPFRCGLSAPPTASRFDPSGGMAIENTLLLSYYGQRFHNPIKEEWSTIHEEYVDERK